MKASKIDRDLAQNLIDKIDRQSTWFKGKYIGAFIILDYRYIVDSLFYSVVSNGCGPWTEDMGNAYESL